MRNFASLSSQALLAGAFLAALTGAGLPASSARAAEQESGPALRLVGSVKSSSGGFGIFNQIATGKSVRVKIDEQFEGWTLTSIGSGEVTFERSGERVTLRTSSTPSVQQGTQAQRPSFAAPTAIPLDTPSLGIVQSPPRTPPQPTRPAMVVPMGNQRP